jgi:hypothetical protein
MRVLLTHRTATFVVVERREHHAPARRNTFRMTRALVFNAVDVTQPMPFFPSLQRWGGSRMALRVLKKSCAQADKQKKKPPLHRQP